MTLSNSLRLAGGILTPIILWLGAARAQQPPQPAGPALTVPAGFVIERVAGPPLVNRPIVADFDMRPNAQVAIDDHWSALRFRANRPGEGRAAGDGVDGGA